jgi:hypothetical protein
LAGLVRLRLEGAARLATHDQGSGARNQGKAPKVDDWILQGSFDYDTGTGTKKITRFDLVALSETGHHDEIKKRTLPLGISFELSAGRTPAERAPSFFTKVKDYFGPRAGPSANGSANSRPVMQQRATRLPTPCASWPCRDTPGRLPRPSRR